MDPPPVNVSLIRRLMGDEAIGEIDLYEPLPAELEARMRAAYPEANVADYSELYRDAPIEF